MHSKYRWIFVVLLALGFGVLGFGVGRLAAAPGTLDSPGPPGSTLSYTLKDIYDRLDTGAAGSQNAFTEPSAGPGTGTGHTLNETMAKAPTADNTYGAVPAEVLTGKTYWGLHTGGTWGPQTGTAAAGSNVSGPNGFRTFTIPDGFYSGSKTATANDSGLVSGNIRSGVSIFSVAGDPMVVNTSSGDAVAGEILQGKKAWVDGAEVTGNIATQTVDNTTVNQAAGYYSAFDLSAVDTDLASGNIRSSVSIYGLAGDPMVVNTSSGDATTTDIAGGKKAWVDGSEVTGTGIIATGDAIAGDVLKGKTFSNDSAAGIAGTMPDNGAVTIMPTTTKQEIALGYHNGLGWVEADSDLVAGNIKSGVDIFGVAGSVIEATGDATAADVLTGKTFSNDSAAGIVGTMPNNKKVVIAPTRTNQTIALGYHNGLGYVEGDADLVAGKIKSGVDIFGVVGTFAGFGVGVPKTGQTISDTIGDDGDLKMGVAWPNPRFTDNGDGTVTDNLTGLIWLKSANCFGIRDWWEAVSDANTLNDGECGLGDGSSEGDWRLPNVRELQSLVHYGVYSPAVPNTAGTGKWSTGDPFTGVQEYIYWSSTTDARATSRAWYVYLYDGYVIYADKTNTYYVWPVRGGQ